MKKKIYSVMPKSLILALLVTTVILLCGCSEKPTLPEYNGDINCVESSMLAQAKIDEITEKYHDNYAFYYTAEEYGDLLTDIGGSYKGIGVYIYQNEDTGRVTVMSAMKGSPAYNAGLQTGDEFLKIDGEDVSDKQPDYISNVFKSAEIGTEFEVLINRPKSGELTLHITVSDVEYPTVDSVILSETEGIGLIKISSFNLLTADQFTEQYNQLLEQGMKALILDLRDNGGGEMTSALKIADFFVPADSNLMYMVSSEKNTAYSADKDAVDIPLLVLQNENSASASEILIGALQDNQVAVTLGTKTFGKGIVQSIISLESGAGLRYTYARYLTAAGHEVHEIGISPDIEYAQPEGTDVLASFSMNSETDPQLKKAISEIETLMKNS